jgi:hypothetical protein
VEKDHSPCPVSSLSRPNWTGDRSRIRLDQRHRDPTRFRKARPFYSELRRRLWATVVELDLKISSAIRLKPRQHPRHWRLPTELPEEEFGSGAFGSRYLSARPDHSTLNCAVAFGQLSSSWTSRSLSTAASRRSRCRPIVIADRISDPAEAQATSPSLATPNRATRKTYSRNRP